MLLGTSYENMAHQVNNAGHTGAHRDWRSKHRTCMGLH